MVFQFEELNLNSISIFYSTHCSPPPHAEYHTATQGIFGVNPRWDGAPLDYILFFIGFGWLWIWF